MNARLTRIGTGWILAMATLLFGVTGVRAAGRAENRAYTSAVKAFDDAVKAFNDEFWYVADKDLGQFLQKYPKSEYRTEALVRQAQARCKLGRGGEAVGLLLGQFAPNDRLADECEFWIGEGYFRSSNYLAAAESYDKLLKDHPNSSRSLTAAYNQAVAYSLLGDWKHVAGKLGEPSGPVWRNVQTNPTNDLALNAVLLRAEAQLVLKDFPAAWETLRVVGSVRRPPSLEWPWQYIVCRLQLGQDKSAQALQGASNLVALAEAAKNPDRLAESLSFRASVLETQGRWTEAQSDYEKILAPDIPTPWKNLALLKIVGLLSDQGRYAEAETRLNTLNPSSPGSSNTLDIAIGELRMQEALSRARTNGAASDNTEWQTGISNKVESALALFDGARTNEMPALLTGRLHLDRGWCHWLLRRMRESRDAFQLATISLPPSLDLAVARFKLGDAQYSLGAYPEALTNYGIVAGEASALPAVRQSLTEPALYQMARAALAADDLASASNTMARILKEYPDSFISGNALLHMGQHQLKHGDPAGAREVFRDFEKRFPGNPLLAEVRLAMARSQETQGDWAGAADTYRSWLEEHPDRPERVRAELSLAWAEWRQGLETNAYVRFTNLVSAFPQNVDVALAQLCAGDFLFRRGDFLKAEENYQIVFQKWPASPVAYEARMMAGRAAAARLRYADAEGYFEKNVNDMNCPPQLVAESLFALADMKTSRETTDTNSLLANFNEAIGALGKISQLALKNPNLFASNEITVLASGRLGDCLLMLGSRGKDVNNLKLAEQEYRKVLTDARAGVAARSQATMGLAQVLEEQALLASGENKASLEREALSRMLEVAYEKNLRDGEKADPFWVRRATLDAMTLAEKLEMQQQAIALGERLLDLMPSQRATLEGRLQRLREDLKTGNR